MVRQETLELCRNVLSGVSIQIGAPNAKEAALTLFRALDDIELALREAAAEPGGDRAQNGKTAKAVEV